MNTFVPRRDADAPADTYVSPVAADPLVEHGYYQWVPLAPGEEVPFEDEDDFGVSGQAQPREGAPAHPAATRASCADPSLAPLPQAGGGTQVSATSDDDGRAQETPLPLAGGAGGGPVTRDGGGPESTTSEIHRSPAGQPVALTPERMAEFLESMQVLGNVSIACQRAGIAQPTAYRARRRHPGFALAWDAAVVAARSVAESELADRAIHGVEEAVFYHGEEVARRRRYDSRLLLAHLARLDKAAERLDVAATLPQLDAQIEALRAGAAPEQALPTKVSPDVLRQAQDERDFVQNPRETEPSEKYIQDSVTPVSPCPDCGGFCEDAQANPRGVQLTETDCMWLGNRLDRMDAARPAGVLLPHQLVAGDARSEGQVETIQLYGFEDGLPEWWLLTSWDAYEAQFDAPAGAGDGGDAEAEAVAGGEADAGLAAD